MRPLSELQERLSFAYRDPELLERALTHRSYANENRLSEHNERMEFLGDAVLNLVVSEQLMDAWPQAPEGDLSRFRAAIVSEPSLAAMAREIGLGEFLRLGRGEEQTGGRQKDSLLADTFEALVASMYLDGGIGAATAFVDRYVRDAVRRAGDRGSAPDYKTALQELCQERVKTLPVYRVVSESGPDHQKRFDVELLVQGAVYGRGTGRSKKEAEQQAAKEAMERLNQQTADGKR